MDIGKSKLEYSRNIPKNYGKECVGIDCAVTSLIQGRDTAVEYASKLQSIARDVPWNERALIFRFIAGLTGHIQRELATKDLPGTLQEAIIFAVRIDNLALDRTRQQIPEHSNSRHPTLTDNKHSSSTICNLILVLAPQSRLTQTSSNRSCFRNKQDKVPIPNTMSILLI